MAQISLRIPDELASDLKAEARTRNLSLNGYLTFVLEAATDPDLEDSEAEQLRARLKRAGLLEEWSKAPPAERPDREELEAAAARAGRGKPLSEYILEERR